MKESKAWALLWSNKMRPEAVSFSFSSLQKLAYLTFLSILDMLLDLKIHLIFLQSFSWYLEYMNMKLFYICNYFANSFIKYIFIFVLVRYILFSCVFYTMQDARLVMILIIFLHIALRIENFIAKFRECNLLEGNIK